MSETLYTYIRVYRPDGTEGYDRVPLHLAAGYPNRIVEELVAMPQHAPYKNGELPGGGSRVVDSVLLKAKAAQARRELRDAQDALAALELTRSRLGDPSKPKAPTKAIKHGRIVEP